MPLGDIERTAIHIGRQECPVAELFNVQRIGDQPRLEWRGELRHVHYIGANLRHGELHVEGCAGDFLGTGMTDGMISVSGDVGHYLGQGMLGGTLVVQGNAGEFAGGASASSRSGLAGGMLLVHGCVGNNAGYRMRRGTLAVAGDAGDLVARSMLAGTVLVGGRCRRLPGLGMKRGTLLMSRHCRDQLPPTFSYACRGKPLAVDLIFASLRQHSFPCPQQPIELELYSGDQLEGGRGEIMLT
jgi:formylmethanofuran dehydrogenase subunit C